MYEMYLSMTLNDVDYEDTPYKGNYLYTKTHKYTP